MLCSFWTCFVNQYDIIKRVSIMPEAISYFSFLLLINFSFSTEIERAGKRNPAELADCQSIYSLLENISRSQLPKSSNFGSRLLQSWHGSDWYITMRVVLLSHYTVLEFLLSRIVWGAIRNLKSLVKTSNNFLPHCYGFFSLSELNKTE